MDVKSVASGLDSIISRQTPRSGEVHAANSKSERISPNQSTDAPQKEAELSSEDIKNITQEMNKFMEYLNADIQFSLHEKLQRLVVKVVDTKENKVLKEFPPKELLDTLAAIRDYVGVLLDKKV